MRNIQIAVRDSSYARALEDLLSSDGAHRVYVVDQPVPALDGVVVLDEDGATSLAAEGGDKERYVVVARGHRPERLRDLWNAGVRHVIFQGDALPVAQLAILAAEMRTRRDGYH